MLLFTDYTMTNERFFIPGLDGLRFFAFLLIFIHHTNFTDLFILDSIQQIGWIGVDIFFCLSAFLLTKLLHFECKETGTINILNFFWRRILRVWPLYFTYVTVLILWSIHEHSLTYENWYRAISLLTFTDNIFTALYYYNPIQFTGHLWTIAYEEQFYLLLPFIILFLFRKTPRERNYFLLLLFLIGFIIRTIFIFIPTKHPAIWVLPITHFESILIGICIGFIEIKSLKFLSRITIIIVSMIGFATIFFLPKPNVISHSLLLLYPCIGLIAGSFLCIVLYSKNEIIEKIVTYEVFVYLGKISFGLYVFHNLCFAITDHCLRTLQIKTGMLSMILALFFTISMASLSYHILEKRFLAFKKRFTVIPSRPA